MDVAQAVTTAMFGPCALYLMATMPLAMFEIIIGDEEGRDPAGALFDHFQMFFDQRAHAADARTDVHAEPLGRNAFGGHAAVVIRLRRRGDRVLRKKIRPADFAARNIERRVKPAHLARKAHL